MSKSNIALLACASLTAAFIYTAPAMAHALPSCENAGVLAKINRQLAIGEKNVVQSGDPIIHISQPHQTKVRENGPRITAQRYCRAKGETEQGRTKTLFYLIEQHAGFASFGYGVEACINGRDPWKIHGAYCHSVR